MCLIALALRSSPAAPLVVVANRDEFHSRPTEAAHFWSDAPGVLAGRDLEGGGTWLGVTRAGRFVAVTNYREPGVRRAEAPSRGGLVADFLLAECSAVDFLRGIEERAGDYNGFNLLVGTASDMWYFSNRGGTAERLEAGVYGLSNHLLDTPWPKVERLTRGLQSLVSRDQPPSVDELMHLANDRRRAPDDGLPDTGIPLEWERLLSAPLIVSPEYGTRSTTALVLDNNGNVAFHEATRNPDGRISDARLFEFEAEAGADS